jgi:general secretion pathway protein H
MLFNSPIQARAHLNQFFRFGWTPATGVRKKNLGFTLIEILIVIVIISVVASFAVLSININQNKRLESLTQQFVNMITLAEEEALLRPATLGLSITPHHFRFYEFHPEKNKKNAWIPVDESSLGKHFIPKNTEVTLKIQNHTVASDLPQLIISPSGDVTPFVIFIGKKDAPPLFKITGMPNGEIKSERIDEK